MGKNTDKKKKLQDIDESEIIEENIPAILRVCGEEGDPNLSYVPHKAIPIHLRERFWIKQWSPSNRWQHRDFCQCRWMDRTSSGRFRAKLG